jgi:dihydrofolate reductase
MHRTIVIAFATLDGVIEDPDGSGGTPAGGWAFRHGPEVVTNDPFKLGPLLGSGVLLLGRKTWQQFSGIWPERTDAFSLAMNRIPKLVASRTVADLSAWGNSSLITGDLLEAAAKAKASHDVIVSGSASVIHALAEAGLVDEYRILVLPDVAGAGTKLFTGKAAATHMRLVSAQTAGPAVLLRYERAGL